MPMLISLPYPFGPELEVCCLRERHFHLYWVLPITKAEREFKAEHGQDALEEWRSMPRRSSSGSRNGHPSYEATRERGNG